MALHNYALMITLLAVIALALAIFTYFSKSYLSRIQRIGLILLRTGSLFLIFILLLNPKISNDYQVVQKPKLAILIDNTQSIAYFKQADTVRHWLDNLKKIPALADRYELQYYSFGKSLQSIDQLKFDQQLTDISKAVEQLEDIQGEIDETLPVILITDGNQNYGKDYRYLDSDKVSIYPICVGDTIKHNDLKIERININKYVFAGHLFPMEIFINYNGSTTEKSHLRITQKNQIIYSKLINLDPLQSTLIVIPYIKVKEAGIKTYKVSLEALNNEKNIVNNTREVGVEVINDKIRIAIISSIIHPDIGKLVQALSSNNQNQIDIYPPEINIENLKNSDALIFYQPDISFANIFEEVKKMQKNYFLISGKKTDWTFINKTQQLIHKIVDERPIMENMSALPNFSFDEFMFEDIGFSGFPSLTGQLGKVRFQGTPQTLLYQQINGARTISPLLATLESGGQRTAYLFGEGIWKWRMQSFVDHKDFADFDSFIGKLMFYLSSDNTKNRISIDYQPFYYQGQQIILTAQFFDKNYQLERSINPIIRIEKKEQGKTWEQPMSQKNTKFEANLNDFSPGQYRFTIREPSLEITSGGQFEVIAYHQEYQENSADYSGLNTLATHTRGSMIQSVDDIKSQLLIKEKYKKQIRTYKTYSPLIEWWLILGAVVVFLSVEWFARKYFGLV